MASGAALMVDRACRSRKPSFFGVTGPAAVVAGSGAAMSRVATAAAELAMIVEAGGRELPLGFPVAAEAALPARPARRMRLVTGFAPPVRRGRLLGVASQLSVASDAPCTGRRGVVRLVAIGAGAVLGRACGEQELRRVVVALHAASALGRPPVRQMAARAAVVPGLAAVVPLRPDPGLLGMAFVAGARRSSQIAMGLVAAHAHPVAGRHDLPSTRFDPVAVLTIVASLLAAPVVAVGIVAKPAVDLSVLQLSAGHHRPRIRRSRPALRCRAMAVAALLHVGPQHLADAIAEHVAAEAAVGILRGVLRSGGHRLVQPVRLVTVDADPFDRPGAMLVHAVTVEARPLEHLRRMGTVSAGGRNALPRRALVLVVAGHAATVVDLSVTGAAIATAGNEPPTQLEPSARSRLVALVAGQGPMAMSRRLVGVAIGMARRGAERSTAQGIPLRHRGRRHQRHRHDDERGRCADATTTDAAGAAARATRRRRHRREATKPGGAHRPLR